MTSFTRADDALSAQRTRRLAAPVWIGFGALALVALWSALAATQLEYVLPGPGSTATALQSLVASAEFWQALGLTLLRATSGLALALVLGIAWGYLSSRWQAVEWFTRPTLQVLMSTPAVIFVIIALVWFGNSGGVVIMVVTLVTIPVLCTTTTQAVRSLDEDLLEMARVFALSRWLTVRHIGIPSVVPPVLAAATVALGQSIRVAVMAELLATASGIGGFIRLAQINIETPTIFAYAVAMAALTFFTEVALIAPIRRRLRASRP